MSQVKKLQLGGTTPATPSSPQYTFKINGTTYTKDEQSLRDQFNPIFDKAVAAGEASEHDREKWIQSFEGNILANAKNGSYNINSSNGKFYRADYTGTASNDSLGLNSDGSTARKSFFGNLISKKDKSDAQRTSWLDGAFGNSILQMHSADDAKAKADVAAKAITDKEAADKLKATGFQGALDHIDKLRLSYGTSKWGSNFKDDPTAIFQQYWDKGVNDHTRLQQGSEWLAGQYKGLFDPKLDAYKEDLKSHGFDLDDYRQKATQEWDSTKGTFKQTPKQLLDLERMSNVFGTMKDNKGFFNRAAYDEMLHPNATTPTGTPAVETKPILQHDDLFTQDSKHFFKDKEGKTIMSGWGKNSTLYDNDGSLYTGHHVENGSSGTPEYNHPLSGFYIEGHKVDGAKMNNYMNALSANPVNADMMAGLQKKRAVMQEAYNNVYGARNNAWVSDFGDTNDATRSWTSTGLFKSGHVDSAMNITDLMENLKGASVLAYKSKATDDNDNPQAFHAVRLANGKTFTGIIKHDYAGNVTGMTDVHNKAITDPDLLHTLKGVRLNQSAQNKHHNVFDFDVAGTPANHGNVYLDNPTSGLYGMKNGGVFKHQVGGTISTNIAPTKGDQPLNKATVTKQVTLGNFGKSMSDPNYSLSGSDKAELIGLALNLGGVAASFTGAGSVASAGLGAAGSLTQFGAETARHGFQWGDLGGLALNLGLDAASAVPGLGILGEGSKALRSITKVSKFLVPALTTLGLARSAGVITDLATGKKSFSDLNVDDVQALVGGIHAVVGGSRAVTQAMGTTKGQSIKLPLKGGDSLEITPDEAQSISMSTDKYKAAQDVALNAAIRAGRNDVPELDTKKVATWNWRKPLSFTKEAPVTGTQTSKYTQLKDINDYQGDGLKNALYRRAINLSAIRNPQLAPSDVNQQFGLLGDYGKTPTTDRSKLPAGTGAFSVVPNKPLGLPQIASETAGFGGKPESTIGDIPDTRRIYGSMFGMRNLDNERSISYNDVRNRLQGLTGTKSSNSQLKSFLKGTYDEGTMPKSIQDQILEAINDPASKGWLKFKDGGIVKAQLGSILDSGLNSRIPDWRTRRGHLAMNVVKPAVKTKPVTSILATQPSNTRMPAFSGTLPTSDIGYTPIPINTTPASPELTTSVFGQSTATGKNVGNTYTTPTTDSGGKSGFHIDPNTLSELGRALYTSKLNSHFDTRVERPLADAPLEVPISVRGSLAATSFANKQANDLIQGSQQYRSSDGTTQMLGNLQAQANAGSLRMQGEAQNQQMLEQTRGQAQQAAMQNASVRTQVNNQNVDTLARAAQAERAGENEKYKQVNQPLVDFWKDTNYKNYVQSRENRALDTQIAGISEQNKVQVPMQMLQQQMYKVFQDTTLTPEQQNAKYMELQNQLNVMQGKSTQAQLEIRKDPYSYRGTAPGYYLPTQKEGGQVKLQVQENKSATANATAIAKQNAESIKDDSDTQTKKSLQAMKDITSLIAMALKGK